MLLELTINFSLEKIVKGSTREENTLDLVLINDVETFTYCGSIVMAPISDHRMTTFNVTDTSGERKEFENTSKWGLHLKKQTGIKSAKKSNIPLYRQRRPIQLKGRIIKLNSKWTAFETQIQKQFIWTTNKQLKEEKIVDLNREIQTLY